MAMLHPDLPTARRLVWPPAGLALLGRRIAARLARDRANRHLRLAAARLDRLSPHLLADIGLTPGAVAPERPRLIAAGRT